LIGNASTDSGLWLVSSDGNLQHLDSIPTTGLAGSDEALYRLAVIRGEKPKTVLAIYDSAGLTHSYLLKFDTYHSKSIAYFDDSLAFFHGGSLMRLYPASMQCAPELIESKIQTVQNDVSSGIVHPVIKAAAELFETLERPPVFDLTDNCVLVADDAEQRLNMIAVDGPHRQLQLDCRVRALASDRNSIYVASEKSNAGKAKSTISTIDKLNLKIGSVLDLPISIEAIAVVSRRLAHGLEIGGRTNRTRVIQEDQIAMFESAHVRPSRLWASTILPRGLLRARIDLVAPPNMAAGSRSFVPIHLMNTGDFIYTSTPPHPIELCFKWIALDRVDSSIEGKFRTPLRRALPPFESMDCEIFVVAPDHPGRYELQITLKQEGVDAADTLPPSGVARSTVDIA